MCDYDETGTMGKGYRRQDEIGTPYVVTVDYDTEKDDCVTVRGTMEPKRMKIDEVEGYIKKYDIL